jgi:conserved domain protein
MKKEIICELYNGFEAAAVEVEGIECWSARELQLLLGYSKWENFSKVIEKAKIACGIAGYLVSDHFPDVRKMVNLGSFSYFILVPKLFPNILLNAYNLKIDFI